VLFGLVGALLYLSIKKHPQLDAAVAFYATSSAEIQGNKRDLSDQEASTLQDLDQQKTGGSG
jgi:hypothetical protein